MKLRRSLPIVDSVPPARDAPAPPRVAEHRDLSRADTLWFHARTLRQRILRLVRDRGVPPRAPRFVDDRDAANFANVVAIARSSTPLWTNDDPLERPLVAGKVHNLRVAARSIDGAVVSAGATWSFWGEVGPPWRAFGFVDGRELREGCLVPSVGGGLCQLSNAIYGCALDAGMEIVERHAHTAKLVGLAGASSSSSRDATVFWSYVDLRFRVPLDSAPVVVRARVVGDRLEVRLESRSPVARSPSTARAPAPATARPTLIVDEHACDTCNQHGCDTGEHARARLRASATKSQSRTAFLVDEHIPELAALIARERRGARDNARDDVRDVRDVRDAIALPLPGAALRMPQYAWDTSGLDVVTAASEALRRSREMRALSQEGARRVRAMLEHSRAIARAYAKQLGPEVDRVVVAQSLAPFLWNESALGGRIVEVFAHRLPLDELHKRLDDAAERFPDDPLLRAFRAPAWLVDAEREVLANAARIVTPHLDVARVLSRCEIVPWSAPPAEGASRAQSANAARRIVFAGPSSSRKGAHAVRDAARAHALTVVIAGSDLMPDGFWAGVEVERATWSACLRMIDRGRVRAVVQPALVEDQPRRLLDALAHGALVVTTSAAGLPPHSLLREVAFGAALDIVPAVGGTGLRARHVSAAE